MLALCLLSLLVSVYSQSNVCPSWSESMNTNTPGGTDVPSARTLDDCKAGCLNSSTSCIYGFDWNTAGGAGTLCYISRTSVTSTNSGISHFTCPTIRTTPAGQSSTTATIPSGATPRPSCSLSWQYVQYNNSNVQGSVKQSSLTQLDACQNGCLTTSWCSGIDWNAMAGADERCWFSIKPQSDIQLNSYPGVTHYHLVCSNSGNPGGSVTGGAATPPQGCSWIQQANTNTANGVQVSTANTLSDCQMACLSSSDKCSKGFDWNAGNAEGSRCYLSTLTTLNTGATSITHYSLKCDSTTAMYVASTPASSSGCSWMGLNNTNSPNGNLQQSLITFEQCRDTCLQNVTGCGFGFDWNPMAPQGSNCWFATSNSTTTYIGVTHYYLVCNSGVTSGGCSWTQMTNMNSPGGVVQNSLQTLDQCQNRCLQQKTTTCPNGIDWDSTAPAGSQCWFSTSSTTTTSNGVTHYNFNCLSGSGTTGPANACFWNAKNNTNSPGGMLQSSANSLDQCQTLCQQKDTDCMYGIDWVWNSGASPGSLCWFSKSNSTSSASGVSHYDQVCSGCSWNKLSNTNSPGGSPQSSLTTLQQCQDGCKNDPSCKNGLDFNPSAPTGSQCWWSTSTTTSTYNGVDHYNYVCSNSGTTMPGCTWLFLNNTNSPGGMVQPSLSTVEACRVGCFQEKDRNCKYGFDWNSANSPGAQCWFSQSNITSTYNGVLHYYMACSASSLTVVPVPACNWTDVQNTNSPGGISQPSLPTSDLCKNGCLQERFNSCKFGIDFNTAVDNQYRCWFSVSNMTSTFVGNTHSFYSC